MHGSDCRVYLAGRDASGDLHTVTPDIKAATHDATTFNSGGWEEADPGRCSWECSIDGFHDPAAGGITLSLEALLGTTGGILSIYDGDANAIGDAGTLFSDAIVTTIGESINVNDLIKLKGSLKPATGGARVGIAGKMLHVSGAETATGTESSLDNTASSANGGRANLHITAITGTWTIVVEESADDSNWAAIATFSGKTATGGFTAEVTGTVKQYLRASHTEDSAGSCTYVLGFARY
jgi:hypothetical protein